MVIMVVSLLVAEILFVVLQNCLLLPSRPNYHRHRELTDCGQVRGGGGARDMMGGARDMMGGARGMRWGEGPSRPSYHRHRELTYYGRGQGWGMGRGQGYDEVGNGEGPGI
jgi:hypothetical protein